MTTMPPRCIFCGTTTGPFDDEDVFARWFRGVLPEVKEVKRGSDDSSRQPYRTNVLIAKLRKAICKHCNNGWMSVLENDAKSVLADMMSPSKDAIPVRLDRPGQRIAAFWAVEKALCLELALRQTIRGYTPGHISADHFGWLYDHRDQREPPPGTKVWLFAFQAQETGTNEGFMSTHQSVSVSNKTKDADRPVGYLSTFTVGCLGLQVFGHDLIPSVAGPVEPEPLRRPESLRPFLIQVSPALNPVANWPRGVAGIVRAADLNALGTWGSMLAPPS